MRMNVRRVGDASAFLEAAGPLLLADEARHNLLLGLAGRIREDPGAYPEVLLWLVEDGLPVGAALQTPPHNLVVAQPAASGALETLAGALSDEGVNLPGVNGAVPEVDAFAGAWELRRSTTRRVRMRMRIYQLAAVRPVVGVSGRPRLATGRDRELLVEWARAFAEEALGDAPVDDPERMVDARLDGRHAGFMLWDDDGEPVSMAGWGGETPSGVRIGGVYTPPARRRRGYGSAVTAAVSADRLAAGRRFCFLYTDLANPTSNKIYANIGYEPVCDSVDYEFEPR